MMGLSPPADTTTTSTSSPRTDGTVAPDTGGEACPDCGGSGYDDRWTTAEDGFPYRTKFCDCAAGAAAREEEAAARKEANAQARRQLYDRAGIPPEFRDLTVQSLRDRCAELDASDGQDASDGRNASDGKAGAIEAAVRYVRGELDAPGLLVYGWYGVGKTGLLTAVYKALVAKGTPGLWVDCYDLLDAVQDYSSGKSRERLQRAKEVPLLFLDDFGSTRLLDRRGDANAAADHRSWRSRRETDDKQLILDKLISHRHRSRLRTLITTNLTLNQLSQQYDERIIQRVMQHCRCVEMAGLNFRTQR